MIDIYTEKQKSYNKGVKDERERIIEWLEEELDFLKDHRGAIFNRQGRIEEVEIFMEFIKGGGVDAYS